MKNTILLVGLILALAISGPVRAAEKGAWWKRDTLTNRFGGAADRWSDKGVDISLGLTDIYQNSLAGGIPEGRHAGRNTGSYDLELTADLKKLLAIPGATLYTHVEGSWGLSLDEVAVGSYWGINYDAAIETYYNAQVAGWINVSPSLQYLVHPGGSRDVQDAFVAGVRAQMAF